MFARALTSGMSVAAAISLAAVFSFADSANAEGKVPVRLAVSAAADASATPIRTAELNVADANAAKIQTVGWRNRAWYRGYYAPYYSTYYPAPYYSYYYPAAPVYVAPRRAYYAPAPVYVPYGTYYYYGW